MRSDVEPDELTWVDSVPVRPARTKRITIGEYEWSRAAPTAGGLARLTARFSINSTELVVVLVEDRSGGRGGVSAGQTDPPQSRLRVGGRSYLLFIESPMKD